MSNQTSIQNLQDSQLIRIFLDFVQTYHLQYEKISKEISYKCHEATWILASTKATGYGRTESEAYKHALRNMLEILIDDTKYADFFGESKPQETASNYSTFNQEQKHQKNKTSISKPPQYSKPQRRDFKTQTAENSSQESQYIYQQPEQSLHTQPQTESCPQPLLSKYSSIANNSYMQLNHPSSSSKVPIPNNYQSNCKRTTPSLTNSIQYGHNLNQINMSMNKSVKNVNMSDVEINNQQVLIENAKRKMYQLQLQLDNINKENDQLRAQLEINRSGNSAMDKNQNIATTLTASVTLQKSSSTLKPMRVSLGNQANHKPSLHNSYNPHIASKPNIMSDLINLPDHNSKPQTYSNMFCQKQQTSYDPIDASTNQNLRSQKQNHHSKSKMLVPKLKLEILPNYHAKAEKSLNDSLMAIYEQKHGNQKY